MSLCSYVRHIGGAKIRHLEMKINKNRTFFLNCEKR